MRAYSTTAASIALLATSVAAATVQPLVIKGKHFFYSGNHTEFYIRGVAYQENYDASTTSFTGASYTDPLSNPSNCKRDIPWLAKLGTNVIRTYAINPKLNHDACMSMLADAGIYVISDLSQPQQSIQSNDPQWNTELYQRYIDVIDSLGKYDNTIGFFAGNEVTNTANQTEAVAFVKAAVRDSKAYIKAQYSRPMYVGYATSDVPIRDPLAEYFNCGDQKDAIDFWGYNVYSWCGQSTYSQSGYDERTNFFRDYSVPAFFAEYGCNKVEPRLWDETDVLYGPRMAPVWAGGIAYQYFQTTANFGLVTINGNTVTPRQDFINLSKKLATITPSSTAWNAVSTALTPDSCPPVNAAWSATATPLPPSPNEELCNCLQSSLSCVVSDSTSEKQYGTYFGYICGKDASACSGIVHDAKTGDYGAYSVCSAKQQLSYVMNKYYELNGRSSDACDFKGAATLQSPSTSSGNCASLLKAAGSNGAGSAPSPTAAGNSGGGSGSGSGSGGAAAGLTVPKADFSLMQLGFYVIVAGLTGAGMLVL